MAAAIDFIANPNFKNEVVWEAIPNSSQEFALTAPADHILYHGARGPGKTITQIMRFRARVGLGYGSYWRGIIFDVEFKNLGDIVIQAKRFLGAFEDGAVFKESATEYKWVWPTGEELLFRHAKKLKDYDGYHGHEYPFIGWNELTKYATCDLYDKMMSTNRSSFVPELHTPKKKDGTYDTPNGRPLPQIPLEVFSTTNPSGPGHNWVKRRFINRAKPGVLFKETVTVFDPRSKQEVDVVKTQVHIFGSWRENIYLTAAYIAELERIKEPNLRRAWLYGDWDVTAGGAIDDLWNTNVHVLDVFPVPKYWSIDRGFDWGSTHPFCVLWFAECNGEEAKLPNGKVFCPPAGSIVVCGEWYGGQKDEVTKEFLYNNKGIKMGAAKVADGIKKREIAFMKSGHFKTQPAGGPADNQIRDVREVTQETTEQLMSKEGISWTESDKSPGSRRIGLQLIRDRLEAALEGEGKAIYFMRNCEATLALLPPIPRDEEDTEVTDPDYEDHPFDVVKYRILAGNNEKVESLDMVYS